jgi:hypothetical protein
MKCPTCGFEQPDTRADCEYCGLVFAKWRAKQEAVQKAAEPKPAVVPEKALGVKTEAKAKGIPEKVEIPSDSYPNPQRLFELLGSLYLQRNSEGTWVYFPWGAFGRGFAVSDPSLLYRIQKLETTFSLFLVSFVSVLGLASFATFFTTPEDDNPWIWVLGLFLLWAYTIFAFKAGKITKELQSIRGRFNEKQYLSRLLACFKPDSLLSLEAVTLMSTLAGIGALHSSRFALLVGDSSRPISWLWILFSMGGFLLAAFLFYFEKPNRS